MNESAGGQPENGREGESASLALWPRRNGLLMSAGLSICLSMVAANYPLLAATLSYAFYTTIPCSNGHVANLYSLPPFILIGDSEHPLSSL